MIIIMIRIIIMIITGFDFPRGPGAYAPRFCYWPQIFLTWGPKYYVK